MKSQDVCKDHYFNILILYRKLKIALRDILMLINPIYILNNNFPLFHCFCRYIACFDK